MSNKPIAKKTHLSQNIAYLMEECAKERGVDPSELVPAQFKEYILESDIKIPNLNDLGGFNAIKDAYFPKISNALNLEKKRIKEQASINRKLGNAFLDRKFIHEGIEELASRVFSGRIIPSKTIFNAPSKHKNRIVTAVLSDLHFGADLKKEETGALDFGVVEEARRLASIVKQIVNYKPQYRKETELELLILGDIIQNQLHDSRDGAVLAEQHCRAVHLLSQAVGQLALYFPKIRVRCATGNHGRITSRHHNRATYQKFDSHETEIYHSLKLISNRWPNVEFFIPKTPFGHYEVFGKRILYTHGDTVLNPGNPSSAINIQRLENQINKINASLTDSEAYAAAIVGHVHTSSISRLGNGAVMITNAALIPVDNFAVSIGIFESSCGQQIFESVPGFPVGDLRFLPVDVNTDKDSSLDTIIKPWSGF